MIERPLKGISFRKKVKVARERIKFGISRNDTWNLDIHLLAILANGLEKLQEGYSYPSRLEQYEDGPERWRAELARIQSLCQWLYDYDEHESALHTYYLKDQKMKFVKVTNENGKFSGFSRLEIENEDAEARELWRIGLEALAERRQQILDIVMEWLRLHFFELWD